MTTPTKLSDIATSDRTVEDLTNLLSDLQGNILQPHARSYAYHLFLSFNPGHGGAARIRAWIRNLATRRITTALQEESLGRHGAFCSLLLSAEGCRYLRAPMPKDTAFQSGMKSRRLLLNDPPTTQWEPGYQVDSHALLILADHDPVALSKECVRIKEAAHSAGISVVVEEPGYRLRHNGYDIEHFGFREGLSQLKWTFRQDTTNPSQSSPNLAIVLIEEPDSVGHFGSLMVFRKLEQNVSVWQENISHLAAQLEANREQVAAFAVGRYKDGTPVVAYDEMRAALTNMNNFDYSEDFAGDRCPLHAHIRKTNLRNDSEFAADRTEYPGIARRGMSYGVRPDLHAGGPMFPLPKSGVGLLFMCYQSNIEKQFEYIQQVANSSHLPRHDSGPDPLIAQGDSQTVANLWPVQYGSPKRRLIELEKVVTLKGGEYFYSPSITFLRSL